MKKITLILMSFAFIFLGACNDEKKDTDADKNAEVKKQEQNNIEEKPVSDKISIEQYLKDNNIEAEPTETGLYYIKEQDGNGEKPQNGDFVAVHYTGTLLNGTKFDSSIDRNEPIEFQLGVGQVIKGWDEGISLMSVGEKAILIIPSELAYGNNEVGGGLIPANSPLRFDVELVEIKKK